MAKQNRIVQLLPCTAGISAWYCPGLDDWDGNLEAYPEMDSDAVLAFALYEDSTTEAMVLDEEGGGLMGISEIANFVTLSGATTTTEEVAKTFFESLRKEAERLKKNK